jgi:hypothetical protein
LDAKTLDLAIRAGTAVQVASAVMLGLAERRVRAVGSLRA